MSVLRYMVAVHSTAAGFARKLLLSGDDVVGGLSGFCRGDLSLPAASPSVGAFGHQMMCGRCARRSA